MADSPTPTSPSTGAPSGTDEPRRGIKSVLVVTVVAALVLGWIYVLFVYRPEKQIDELTDRAFPVSAEQICKSAMQQVDELPIASMAANPKERGETVAEANAVLATMVAELEKVAPTGSTPEDKGVREWVGDWDQHVKDRTVYADELQAGEDARFLESTKGARQLSRAIDAFAQVNKMPSCETPQDVG
jgi:hypothetical protein